MDKAYEPQHDIKWQKRWEDAGLFSPESVRKRHPHPTGRTFTVMMPPPNVTGVLHQGHALGSALQDALTRWHRMCGDEALFMPGTDHASIAVQMQVVKHLASKGINYRELGREKFLEACWQWIHEYQPRIYAQLKSMGLSCDWSRVAFTMDPELNKGVTEAFVRLHKKGLIYRAEKLVNWSPKGQTVLSDLEVIYKEQEGSLWHFRYPMADNPKEFLVVATTRPETMLGDTAVAVHPDDPRYKKYIGRKILLPIVNREIPVIADDFVEKEFGSGVVKITPAHDFNDFETGARHKLPMINVFTPTAHIISGLPGEGGKLAGLDRFEARERVIELFKNLGLLEKIDKHVNRVGTSERWEEIVEPYLSYQWFLKLQGASQRAAASATSGELEIVPREFHNQFLRWMEDLHDWCISRQLWWGHQIPAYHCERCSHIEVVAEKPAKCAKCGSTQLKQDSDVLDTWFSSGLWPMTTLGWPNKNDPDYKKFFPTQVLETGFDIIFFWVARMVMMSLELEDQLPFTKVYLHPMVRDEQGRKMSKTIGNVIDPLVISRELGADTLRLTLNALCVQGRDLRLSRERLESYRNFINKVWNATRFVLMNEENSQDASWKKRPAPKHLHDQWILNRLDATARSVAQSWSGYRMQEAAETLYHFFWDDYCDWYLESSKSTRAESGPVLKHVLGEALKLIHPLCPHASEELYHQLPGVAEDEFLMCAPFPDGKSFPDPKVEAEFTFLKNFVTGIRNLKAESKVAPGKKIRIWVQDADPLSMAVLKKSVNVISSLAKLEELHLTGSEPTGPVTKVVVPGVELSKNLEIYVPLNELKDLSEELKRVEKELSETQKLFDNQQKKLSNESFVGRAPAEVIDKEKAKLAEYRDRLSRTAQLLKELRDAH
jgi:valyl-tRNA synthetase